MSAGKLRIIISIQRFDCFLYCLVNLYCNNIGVVMQTKQQFSGFLILGR